MYLAGTMASVEPIFTADSNLAQSQAVLRNN